MSMGNSENTSSDEIMDPWVGGDGRRRVILENLRPCVDDGAFPAKRVLGETVAVRVDMFADGHDRLAGVVRWWHEQDHTRQETPLVHDVNDVWEATFPATRLGRYRFTVEGWVDAFETWRDRLHKKARAGQGKEAELELQVGAHLVSAAAARAGTGDDALWLERRAAELDAEDATFDERVALGMDDELRGVMAHYPDREHATLFQGERALEVDPPLAGFSAWYELFPRSCSSRPGEHGTLRDVIDRLDYVESMGFDVLYLPPVHPIGHTQRKGPNNRPGAGDEGPGSPWAIGSEEGGHDAIHPDLGTVEDFVELVGRARDRGIEVAIDLAFQCSPDHPWVVEHPQWFRQRPDGTVQFAENPPKRYEDIFPLDFETEDWQALWEELERIVLVWIERGVRVFRVDNPHTKPMRFWEWLIGRVKERHPEVLFLSEAFTRPKVMARLAKVGFSQSYTYFTWRNTKRELEQYLTELTRTELRDYFRPNFWPNTPDILPQYLQYGGRPAFIIRLILAATLSSSYGIYGPAFELCVSEGVEGREEYLNSEKYEIKDWDLNAKGNIRAVVERVNRVRRQNASLQSIRNVEMYSVDNEMILCYGKATEDGSEMTVTVVNIDPHHRQSGWVRLPLDQMGIDPRRPFLMHDLLSDDKYIWQGESNYIELDPHVMPGHILRVQRRMRRETDFDYFM